MKISHFFIDRPIFAAVVSIVTVIAGALAYLKLPVAQYPDVTPPTIVVRATYPGATAETVAQSVATPIEQEVNGVEDMLYMESYCTNDGQYMLTVTFKLGSDLDKVQVLTQNRVRTAEARLPEDVRRLGVTTEKQSPDLLLVCQLYSEAGRLDQLYISNYATLQMKDVLSRIDGVGAVTLFGAREYSMRVWLDPDKVASVGLTGAEVVQALRTQNVQVAAGALGAPPAPAGQSFQLVLNTQGRFTLPEQFGEVVVKSGEDGRVVRVRDIGRVELGARDYVTNSFLNGQPGVAMAVFQRPGSNALETKDKVLETIQELTHHFPEGLKHQIVYNPTEFIEESITELQRTIFEAVILVVLVVVAFLQNWRSTVIPLLAIPVSLIGTFAVMAAIGFSINNLTLFGLVLAIGIVVDDAIVVVENVERHIARGRSPRDASRLAMDEVGGPVIAIALVLSAVFVPTAFISGISGQFYRQFALTIAVATLISAFNSLTLSPAMSALILKPHGAHGGLFERVWNLALGWFFRLFNRSFDVAGNVYAGMVRRVVRLGALVLIVYVALLGVTGVMFQRVPGGFVPQMDQGYLICAIQLPDGASLERTDAVVKQASQIFLDTPGVLRAIAFSGLSGATQTNATNAAAIYVTLKPFEERSKEGLSADRILGELWARMGAVKGAQVVVLPPPSVRGIGNLGGFTFEVQDHASQGSLALEQAVNELLGASYQDPDLAGCFCFYRANTPQLFADVDRVKAEMLKVPTARVLDTFQVYLGSAFVNDCNLFGRTFHVTAQADARFRMVPDDVAHLRVRSDTGAMVPLGSLARIRSIAGPQYVSHYNLYPSAALNGNAAAGRSSGQAIRAMERLARERLPQGYGFEWTGLYYQQILAGNTAAYIFPLCVLFVFLTLAAQYESWLLPFSIILIVPMCLLFAITGISYRGMDNNVLTQIGFVVLVGLACKNAILIVEFAKSEEEGGKDRFTAAVEACRLRLRPILMTSFAFILGVVPLVIASGPGAEMRQSLGTAVFSGMLGVTFFGLILTPVFYVVVRGLAGLFSRRAVTTPPPASVTTGEVTT